VVSVEEDDRALKIEFYNTRVPFRHVSQVLMLEPGAYLLTGNVKAMRLNNDRGLQWTVRCMTGSKERLGETDRLRGTFPWSGFQTEFHVPDTPDCQTQVLRLELPARIPREEQIKGDIWFDGIRVERLARAAVSQ
jgi:hypothetical protein